MDSGVYMTVISIFNPPSNFNFEPFLNGRRVLHSNNDVHVIINRDSSGPTPGNGGEVPPRNSNGVSSNENFAAEVVGERSSYAASQGQVRAQVADVPAVPSTGVVHLTTNSLSTPLQVNNVFNHSGVLTRGDGETANGGNNSRIGMADILNNIPLTASALGAVIPNGRLLPWEGRGAASVRSLDSQHRSYESPQQQNTSPSNGSQNTSSVSIGMRYSGIGSVGIASSSTASPHFGLPGTSGMASSSSVGSLAVKRRRGPGRPRKEESSSLTGVMCGRCGRKTADTMTPCSPVSHFFCRNCVTPILVNLNCCPTCGHQCSISSLRDVF